MSADDIASHCAFAEKLGGLSFPHLADTELDAIKAFNVVNDRGTGCRRSTFVVDREGVIQHANRAYNVNEESHYQALFDTLNAIK